ncbi:hypothetical protein AB0A98_22415 [Streptomyces chrestomyceticus]|uniref:hypothetical protein n=1 Tax=Streptomyces chrestomyceticus TaxID=68185 RepID=UPI0033CE0970
MKVFIRWRNRRLIGRVALASLLANELEHGDLRDQILRCLDEHGADDVLRDAVVRELDRFRHTARNGMKEASLIELAGGGTFFEEIQAAEVRAKRLLPTILPRSRTSA